MIVTASLNPKSPYNCACPNRIECPNIITHNFIGSSQQLWKQLSGICTVSPHEFTTKHQTDISANTVHS